MNCLGVVQHIGCRSQSPHILRRRSIMAARLLRSWVQNPLGAWMYVCCVCCVFSGRGLCDELITHPEESYRLWQSLCMIKKPREWGGHRPRWAAKPEEIINNNNISSTDISKVGLTNWLMNTAVEPKSSTSRRVSVFSSCQILYCTSQRLQWSSG
jgi:hypothetical protein